MFGRVQSYNLFASTYRRGVIGTVSSSLTTANSVAATYTSATMLTTSTFTSKILTDGYQNKSFAERVRFTFPSFSAIPNDASVTLAVIDGNKYGPGVLWFDHLIGSQNANVDITYVVANSGANAVTMTSIGATAVPALVTSTPNNVTWLYHTFSNVNLYYNNTLTIQTNTVYTISYYRVSGAWSAAVSISAICGWISPLT